MDKLYSYGPSNSQQFFWMLSIYYMGLGSSPCLQKELLQDQTVIEYFGY